MNRKIKAILKLKIITLLLIFGISLWSFAQEKSPANEKVPVAFYPETVFTFQPILEGVDISHDFVVKNKGKDELRIERVNSG